MLLFDYRIAFAKKRPPGRNAKGHAIGQQYLPEGRINPRHDVVTVIDDCQHSADHARRQQRPAGRAVGKGKIAETDSGFVGHKTSDASADNTIYPSDVGVMVRTPRMPCPKDTVTTTPTRAGVMAKEGTDMEPRNHHTRLALLMIMIFIRNTNIAVEGKN